MKCEADIVSGHVKIRGTIFVENFSHSQIFLYNLSHCFPIHIQFCYYSHT